MEFQLLPLKKKNYCSHSISLIVFCLFLFSIFRVLLEQHTHQHNDHEHDGQSELLLLAGGERGLAAVGAPAGEKREDRLN